MSQPRVIAVPPQSVAWGAPPRSITNAPPTASQQQPEATATTSTSLAVMDQHFQQIGCLGQGGFGSVFLAQKQSGRKVALKFLRFEQLDNNDASASEELHDMLTRELEAVLRLECASTEGNNKDLGIVYFEDWFTGPNFACIVMQYVDGGTLAQEIMAKQDALDNQGGGGEPYTERRIAWYALQLCDALAHAHSRGIAHHDVKSANVLIDRKSSYGKLLLADFGSAVSPGTESHNFTELYASPELQRAYAEEEFSGLQPEKVDAFGLGCVLYELLCCKKLVDLTGEQTLAEYIQTAQSADVVFDLPCLRLPWIPETMTNPQQQQQQQQQVGYSSALRGTVRNLLELMPANRCTPTELLKPLKQDPRSPLLKDFVSAAQPPAPGAPVTVDNVQLGMFVQRGRDWDDDDADGGLHSVGVVVKLDHDAGYTEVAFPSHIPSAPPKPLICRIGAGNKFELQVGPTPMKDFHLGSNQNKNGGIIYSSDASKYQVGQMINKNCMVVGIQPECNVVLIAPLEKIPIPALPFTLPIEPLPVPAVVPRKPLPVPDTWQDGAGLLQEVTDAGEKQPVLDAFFDVNGGMDLQAYEVLSIQRVQAPEMWNVYATTREQVAAENWGIVDDKRLFIGTGQNSPENLLRQTTSSDTSPNFFQMCLMPGSTQLHFSEQAQFADARSHRERVSDKTVRKVVLSRVALGRTGGETERPPSMVPVTFHSMFSLGLNGAASTYAIQNPFQAFPEYIISYTTIQQHGRRVIRARRPVRPSNRSSNSSRSLPRRPQFTSPSTNVNANMPRSSPPAASATNGTASRPNQTSLAVNTPTTMTSHNASNGTPSTPASTTKMCVVCMENPVCMILIPCGHPCLCEVCSTRQGLKKLKKKCPECRTPFKQATRFYGRIVED